MRKSVTFDINYIFSYDSVDSNNDVIMIVIAMIVANLMMVMILILKILVTTRITLGGRGENCPPQL